ncbi:hypothetical protein ND748_02230 [Frankia sp. AiPs1]|uniref:sigma-54-dependent Fis family transcriptional regulator n=1 Tax=Frankia sp. AiPs1 TaxID=573493 RepID=UPI002042C7EC|nr:helix-turn-helix domain-containing protein [Frankia sp. AiPs1]MCM3920501.1 hypothetical protein [Frankia sp. AiPs1]
MTSVTRPAQLQELPAVTPRALATGDWIRAVERARSVLDEAPQRMVERPAAVSPVVYESWRRSRMHGVSPHRVRPAVVDDLDLNSQVALVVEPVVARNGAALDQASCALSLTDHEGCVLRRWVPDPELAKRMDEEGIRPGFSVAEMHLGTTSAISLLSNKPVLIRGPEHFVDQFRDMTCAGVPIVHPVTRRTVGSLDLTCRFADTSPLVLPWLMELAAQIQKILLTKASRRERLLLDAYLAHNRDSRHPLVALDQKTIITNAAAARLLGGLDQAMLWEHAAQSLRAHSSGPRSVVLSNGTRVRIVTWPLTDGPDLAGAVLMLKKEPEYQQVGRQVDVPALPGLVGRSPAWRATCREVARLSEDAERVLVVGEQGSGRTAVARAIAGPGEIRLADAADADARNAGDGQRWLRGIEADAAGSAETLIIRNVDLLSPALAAATDAALRRWPRGRRIIATSATGPMDSASPSPILDTFSEVVEVAPLRHRQEDLALLLAALTSRLIGDGPAVRWMPDAVQALSRLEWPGNVASLEALVKRMVSRCSGGYIGAANLPADIVAHTSWRRLGGLEQAEARMIVQALRETGGNKQRAAEVLGIARSTLYRKVRSLGLDLSSTAY